MLVMWSNTDALLAQVVGAIRKLEFIIQKGPSLKSLVHLLKAMCSFITYACPLH